MGLPVLDALEAFFSEPQFTSAISDFMSLYAGEVEVTVEGAEQPIKCDVCTLLWVGVCGWAAVDGTHKTEQSNAGGSGAQSQPRAGIMICT